MLFLFLTLLSLLVRFSIEQPLQNATGQFLTDNAICLDGTPGLYYVYKSDIESLKYVIFFQGGGQCSGLSDDQVPGPCFESCYHRSKSSLGSTKQDPAWIDLNSYNSGYPIPPILTQDPNTNPLMKDWNHVFVRYCDGAFYGGNKMEPDEYDGSKIYYRGSFILNQLINTLNQKWGMNEATDIVISGCSAGSQAVYININNIYSLLNNPENMNVFTISDSGFIIDTNGIYGDNTNMSLAQNMTFQEQNMSGTVPGQCITDMKAKNMETYHCVMPQYNSKYIEQNVNFFALQSQFDSFQRSCVLGSNQTEIVQQFGMNITNLVNNSLLLTSNNNGAMIDSCSHHCGGWNEINLNGVTQCDAFTSFYKNNKKQRVWYQNQTFPCDSCCDPPNI